jgi:hypothetical protein
MFDVIERLKTDWTDKYVVIDSEAPELARFAKTTGQVKTVNMNGRCLVEFDQFNNIGWYDIDPSALKVVPKPLPKPPEAKEPKAAPAPKTAPKTEAKPAAAAAKKPSTADILAAARGKAGGAAPAVAKPAGKPSTAEILAQARGAKAAAPAATEEAAETGAAEEPAESVAPEPKAAAPKKAAGGPLPTTTADKIAWCRGHDAKS